MELAFCLMVTSKPQGVVKAMTWMVTRWPALDASAEVLWTGF